MCTFDVIIEIPTGSKNKYEYDENIGRIRFDRMLHTSMQYPADYGFVPNTLALDGDALDVLVLFTEPTYPGIIVEVKPIGVLLMSDDKGEDDKLLAVPLSDPIQNKMNNLEDVNPHILNQIEHFFKVYKDLEDKKVTVLGWDSKEKAIQLYKESLKRYKS